MKRSLRLMCALCFLATLSNLGTGRAFADGLTDAAGQLLNLPHATAEDILLRAHGNDITAMVLSSAGYRFGQGGFPAYKGVATMWTGAIERSAMPQAFAFAALLSVEESSLTDEEAIGYHAACSLAMPSRFTGVFKQTGVFDADAVCGRIAKRAERIPDWRRGYDAILEESQTVQKEARATIAFARKLTTSPVGEKDGKEVLEGRYGPIETILFYAATSHDPETESPDWQARRLLSLIAAQEDAGEAGHLLRTTAKITLLRRLGANAEQASTLIRLAHAKDAQAARSMGLHYLNGNQGFPIDGNLQNVWIRYGAYGGDALSMELRAMDLFSGIEPEAAWVWARLAEEYGDSAVRKRMSVIIADLEQSSTPQRQEARERLLLQMREHIFSLQ